MLEKLLDWNSKMVKWTPDSLRKWANTRKKGRSHYVFWRGVVVFGGLMMILMTIFWSGFQIRSLGTFVGLCLQNLIIYSIAGYFWGYLTWTLIEYSYEQYFKQHPDPEI